MRRRTASGSRRTNGFPGDGGTLILDLEVGMGEIEVRRVESEVDSGSGPFRRRPSQPPSTTERLG